MRSERNKKAKDISHEGDAEAKACLGWTFSGGMGGWPVLKIDQDTLLRERKKLESRRRLLNLCLKVWGQITAGKAEVILGRQ